MMNSAPRIYSIFSHKIKTDPWCVCAVSCVVSPVLLCDVIALFHWDLGLGVWELCYKAVTVFSWLLFGYRRVA